MPFSSTEVHLARRPKGMAVPEDFVFVTRQLPDPGEGEVLVRNLFISVDPYMRGRMNEVQTHGEGFRLNEVMSGGAIGRIVASRHNDFEEGDLVSSNLGWREGFLSDGDGLQKLPDTSLPVTVHMGPLGLTGRTAYDGLLGAAELREGETVFVSGAAGAVGSIAGQIARLKGCRTIGSAGSAEKVAFCREVGFDHAFNYHDGNLAAQVHEGAPEGIDVYFDNVGGEHLEAALANMRLLGRVAICGAISHYNDTVPAPGPSNLRVAIRLRLTLRGFVVGNYPELREPFERDMRSWVESGQIAWRETIQEGIRNAPDAFIGLFTGENIGKMIVKVA